MPDELKDPAARIIICEDEALIAMDVPRILRNLGYQVPDTVFTGEEAVRVAEETEPVALIEL